MINKIKTRMASEEGFTLIELLVVMIILGILVAIAVPAYLSLTGKAKTAAGEANVRSAIPAAETWYQDDTNNGTGTYAGISRAKLVLEAPGIGQNVTAGSFDGSGTASAYCIEDTEPGGKTYSYVGGDPGTVVAATATGVVAQATCASLVPSITMS